jgi:phosphomannomutase
MCEAVINGLTDGGADTFHIGQCGTEEIYFATDHFGMDGGIVVTASHNPKDYNGMKLVRAQSRPISGDSGLNDIRDLCEANAFSEPGEAEKGKRHTLDHRGAYIARLLQYVDIASLASLKIVVNAGNGGAGEVIDRLETFLPFEFIKVHHEPDGNFPNGVPNPLLPDNRAPTIEAISESSAHRCFFFDESGRFIEGYYIVGLLAQAFLEKTPGEKVVHDPRLTWNTVDIAAASNGIPVMSKTGHAFIKERMRQENAIYGGEMSAHHYFRDFAYCDSGMVPWLLVAGLMSSTGKPLSALVDERMALFPASGEINRRIDDPPATLKRIEQKYAPGAVSVDHTDGLSVEFEQWRFNVRMSNTEPVVRLNVESRANEDLMNEKTDEILGEMGGEAI